MKQETWQKLYDEMAETNEMWGLPYDSYQDVAIKKFISVLLEKEYEKGREEKAPMGISQWRNHGKKWHYWEFFEKQVKKESPRDI